MALVLALSTGVKLNRFSVNGTLLKVIFYLVGLLAVADSFVSVFMPYYPNSTVSSSLTTFARENQDFERAWKNLSKHGAISCEYLDGQQSKCIQDGFKIKNPMNEYLVNDRSGFDLYIIPNMIGGAASVYVDKHKIEIPFKETESVVLKIVSKFSAMRNITAEY